jgi:hypothetical protein
MLVPPAVGQPATLAFRHAVRHKLLRNSERDCGDRAARLSKEAHQMKVRSEKSDP